MSGELPSDEAMRFARECLDRNRTRALSALLTSEHIENVTSLVLDYVDHEDMPTAGDIAVEIIEYLAVFILAPLLPSEPQEQPQ